MFLLISSCLMKRVIFVFCKGKILVQGIARRTSSFDYCLGWKFLSQQRYAVSPSIKGPRSSDLRWDCLYTLSSWMSHKSDGLIFLNFCFLTQHTQTRSKMDYQPSIASINSISCALWKFCSFFNLFTMCIVCLH